MQMCLSTVERKSVLRKHISPCICSCATEKPRWHLCVRHKKNQLWWYHLSLLNDLSDFIHPLQLHRHSSKQLLTRILPSFILQGQLIKQYSQYLYWNNKQQRFISFPLQRSETHKQTKLDIKPSQERQRLSLRLLTGFPDNRRWEL